MEGKIRDSGCEAPFSFTTNKEEDHIQFYLPHGALELGVELDVQTSEKKGYRKFKVVNSRPMVEGSTVYLCEANLTSRAI